MSVAANEFLFRFVEGFSKDLFILTFSLNHFNDQNKNIKPHFRLSQNVMVCLTKQFLALGAKIVIQTTKQKTMS